MKYFIVGAFILLITTASAQFPFRHHREAVEVRYSSSQPAINYILRVDTADLSSFSVEMRLRNVNNNFRVAMVTHPEYDDRYWRFVEAITVEGKNGKGNVIREDSAVWRISTTGGEALLKYRIRLAPAEQFRGAWRPFLSSRGILFGGPHSFMYVVGETLVASHVELELPEGWKIATGLTPTSDSKIFFAPTVSALVESPILAGIFKSWNFSVDGVPHRVVYWSLPDATPFDTAALLSNMEKLIRQSVSLFGRLPYREYIFMLQDGSWGGLEHNNSVTLGADDEQLRKNMTGFLYELAHEYFHTWNLMRIHPVEYIDVSYKKQDLSRGLWWSEGLTMFYADLLLRRADLPVFQSSRVKHLESLLTRYHSSSGYSRLSAEQVSQASYGPRGMLGDYAASTHGQGEVIGSMLDIITRSATDGRRTMDDIMRKMMDKYSGPAGFTSGNIEAVVEEVCGCDATQFFKDHVTGGKMIDFDKHLALIGLKKTLTWSEAKMDDGAPAPDFRTYAYQQEKDTAIRLAVMGPESIWGKAGLHTGDIIVSVNGKSLNTPRDLRTHLSALKIGDTLSMTVKRSKGLFTIPVVIRGYLQPQITIEKLGTRTQKQKRLQEQWAEGN